MNLKGEAANVRVVERTLRSMRQDREEKESESKVAFNFILVLKNEHTTCALNLTFTANEYDM